MHPFTSACVPACLAVTFTLPVLSAQSEVADSLLHVAQAQAPRCNITEVRRLGGDTILVSLVDSLLSSEAFEAGDWQLCDGVARNQTTRDVSRAILGPLWSAWGSSSGLKTAVLDIHSLVAEDAHLRLAFPAPVRPDPESREGRKPGPE